MAVLALGLAVAAGSGCSKEEGVVATGGSAAKRQVHKAPEGATPKLAFVTNNVSDFWKLAEAGVRQYEKEAGVKVDFKMPPAGKVEEQNRFLEDLTSQGYHGIAVSVIAPDAQVPAINRAASQTNVITHDSDAPGANRLAYIGTNNRRAGEAAGKLGTTQDSGIAYYLWTLTWGLGWAPALAALAAPAVLWVRDRRLLVVLVPGVLRSVPQGIMTWLK